MKRVGRPVFFIVVILIAAITYCAFFGISTYYGDITTVWVKSAEDIRWGIDIRGGVEATFAPPEGVDASDEDMRSAESIIKLRLVNENITDSEVYTDYTRDRIIVRFPWKANETNFDPQQAIQELGQTALLTFREGNEYDSEYKPSGVTAETVLVEGKHVTTAYASVNQQTNDPLVVVEFDEEGAKAFAEATERLVGEVISIWMDDTMISNATVQEAITDGKATITSSTFTLETAQDLANKINAGALPFALSVESYNSIPATMGNSALEAMLLAGVIAFACIAVFMILLYRLPGFVAVIALAGQVALMIASITGFFPIFPSFTLTLPGIAGIILAIGFGVDANIITADRIKEELYAGKSIQSAVDSGFKRAFSAILDGNVTVIIVAIILMGAFGPASSVFAKILSPVFAIFGQSIAGSIYSFGYTLLVGVILNLVMGVLASRLMLKSLSKFNFLKKPWLYGGKNK